MNTLILFFVLLLSFSADAQKIRFTDTTNKWAVLTHHTDGWTMTTTYGLYSAGYTGTFLKDSLKYSVYKAGSFDSALIREDTLSGKIYALVYEHTFFSDTNEFVLFDYSLNVGDTFTTRGVSRKLSLIDSTLINGIWHRVYHMNTVQSSQSYNFIEGIGCTTEPLLPAYEYIFEAGCELICFENQGTTPFIDSSYHWSFNNGTSCKDIVLGVADLSRLKTATVYPNPATDLVRIKLPAALKSGTMKLYNSYGQIVYQQIFSQKEELTVTNDATLKGIYFYSIINEAGTVCYKGPLQFL